MPLPDIPGAPPPEIPEPASPMYLATKNQAATFIQFEPIRNPVRDNLSLSKSSQLVAFGGFTAGPLLPPGLPGMPAPEFGAPGCSWGIRVSYAAPGVANRNGKTVMIAVTRIVISYGCAQQRNGVLRLTFPSPKNLMGLSQKAELRCNSRGLFRQPSRFTAPLTAPAPATPIAISFASRHASPGAHWGSRPN